MNKTDLENNLKNMISLKLFNPNKWCNTRELNLKEYNEYLSKFIKLSSLKINTLNDSAEKATAPIYYLFSCVRNYFFNKGAVEISFKK